MAAGDRVVAPLAPQAEVAGGAGPASAQEHVAGARAAGARPPGDSSRIGGGAAVTLGSSLVRAWQRARILAPGSLRCRETNQASR